jgi:hypothetical protein
MVANITLTATPSANQPQFNILPHPNYPYTTLQLFSTSPPGGAYRDYRVNYTDLSAPSTAGSSQLVTGSNPFDINGLMPGHEYRLSVVGVPTGGGEQQFLWSAVSCICA